MFKTAYTRPIFKIANTTTIFTDDLTKTKGKSAALMAIVVM